MEMAVRYCIIDDEPVTRIQLRQTIACLRPNYYCEGEADDLQGLSRCCDKCPDLLIVNSQLCDGISFDALRKDLNQTPVIVTSSYIENEKETKDLNTVAFLLKPVSKKILESVLDKFDIERNHKHNIRIDHK